MSDLDQRAPEKPSVGKPVRLLDTRLGSGASFAVVCAVTLGLALPQFGDLDPLAKGGLSCALMLWFLVIRVPVGVAMSLAGAIGVWALVGWAAVPSTLGEVPFNSSTSFSLSVLPMFVFMGLLLWRSGITQDLYVAARAWFSWLPGGLAVATNVAGAGLAATSGSTLGISHALARIGVPEMLRAGYDRRLAVGAVMSAGTIGQLIPPSVLLVIYAGFAQVSVGDQLLAGLLPGLLLAAAYVMLIVIYVLVRPSLAPRPAQGEAQEGTPGRWRTLLAIWPVPGLVLLILGGLYTGVFTATEAGAVGCVGVLAVATVRQKPSELVSGVRVALVDTVTSVGSIMFLLIGSAIFNRVLALSGAAPWFAHRLQEADLAPAMLVLLMVVLYVVLGAFMEPIPMMLMTVPVLLPVVVAAGFNALWFGVFIVLLGEIAILSPPVGVLVFVVHKVVQNPEVRQNQKITMRDVYSGGYMFIPGAIAVVVLITVAPGIVSLVPRLSGGG